MGAQNEPNQQQPPAPAGGDQNQQPQQQPAGDPSTAPGAGDPQTPKGDEPLGDAGLRALQAEREARKALEEQLKSLEPLGQLVEAIRGGKHVPNDQKTDVERLSEELQQLRDENAKERLSRLRLEVATETGIPAELAARLQGQTREELAADAAALKALIPAAPEGGDGAGQGVPRRPAPDPTQGGRGGAVDLAAQIAAAETKGDWTTARQLKTQMMLNQQ